MSNLTLADFALPPASAGNDIWGYVSPSGREYALMGLNNQTAFVEVTDPRNPHIVGSVVHSAEIWSDMATYREHAYVVTDGTGRGIQVVDLTHIDEGQITELETYDGQLGYRLTTAHSISINEESGYIYLSGSQSPGFQGLAMLSIADPTTPIRAIAWPEVYVHDALIVTYHGGAYDGREIAFCFAGRNGLWIVDVTEKTEEGIAVLAGPIYYPHYAYTHQGWLSEDRRLLFVDDEMDEPGLPSATTHVFDVEHLETPLYVGSFTNGLRSIDHNLMVRGNYVFEANYETGLRVWDVSNVTQTSVNAVEIGYFDTYPDDDDYGYAGAWGVFSALPSGIVLISDIQRGLFVLDPVSAVAPIFAQAQEPALTEPTNAQGVAWGDFDGDADADLYVTQTSGGNRLYENTGAGFEDVTPAGLADLGEGRSALWFDVDEDADLDLYVGNSNSAQPDKLFRNDGGVFTDVSEPPLGDIGPGRGVAAADFDRDGDLDLYLAKFGSANRLFRNDRGVGFVDVAAAQGVADGAQSGGTTWADLDGDLDPDLLVANLNAPDRIYMNTGSGFTDVGGGVATGHSMSVACADYDNDGDLDVFFGRYNARSVLLRNDGPGIFTDVTSVCGIDLPTQRIFGLSFGDVNRDGWVDLVCADLDGGLRLFENRGDGTFIDRTGVNFVGNPHPMAAALADVDGNGAPELFAGGYGVASQFYRNVSPPGKWLEVALQASRANFFGVGARVVIEADGLQQIREITAGHGYLSESPLVASFGLDSSTYIDRLRVYWADGGYSERTGLTANQRIVVTEDVTPIEPGEDTGSPVAPVLDRLYPSVPNPFNPRTTITYEVASPGSIALVVLDAAGRMARVLASGVASPGRYEAIWDGRDDAGRPLASGVYYYRLETPHGSLSRPLTLVR